MKILHGFFSNIAAGLFGTVFYLREDGTEVEVTAVYENVDVDYNYPDVEYRGVVTDYNRTGRDGNVIRRSQINQSRRWII